jgi:beta-glucosidase
LRDGGPPRQQIGITLDLMPVWPASDAAADVAAARRVDTDDHLLFLDPVLRGAYPPGTIGELDVVRPGDLDLIGAPIDLLGINYYRPLIVRAASDSHLRAEIVRPDGVPVTAVGWPVQPDAMRELLVGLREDYPGLPPVFITENGAAYPDEVSADGSVHDPLRVSYLHQHLLALHGAMSAGVDVRGYFVWTLLDNFEWAEGYAKRFGIIHVDHADQRRTPKTSARWYARVARDNAVPFTVRARLRGS